MTCNTDQITIFKDLQIEAFFFYYYFFASIQIEAFFFGYLFITLIQPNNCRNIKLHPINIDR